MTVRSILPKILMALTGLIWFGFLIGHLTGNFLLFSGAEKFDAYAKFLESTGGLLIATEVLLILFLAAHIYSAVRLSNANSAARRNGYAVKTTRGRASLASRTMLVGGIILLIFIVTHVYMFKFGPAAVEGETRKLHALVMASFSQPLMVVWYVLAMLALGLHLSHGFGSAFQTLGILNPNWRSKLRAGGKVFGWVISLAFISIPVWAFISQQ